MADVSVLQDSKGNSYNIKDATARAATPTKTSDLTNDSNFVADASYVHTDNNYTTTEKSKLAGIASGAEVNVQADWNVTSSSSDAYIKHKPSIPTKTSDLTNDSDFITTTDAPLYRGTLPSGDLDDAVDPGIYFLSNSSGYTYTNMPGGLTWGVMVVSASAASGVNNVVQTFTGTGGNTYTRIRVSTGFQGWRQLMRGPSAPVRESFTASGLTIELQRTGGCVQLKISGTLSADLATSGAYVDLCTVSENFRPGSTTPLAYQVLNYLGYYGQVTVTTAGVVRIGYVRNRSASSTDIASGTSLYATLTYAGVIYSD